MMKMKYIMAALGVAILGAISTPSTHANAAATTQQKSTMRGYFEFSTTEDGYAIIEKYIGTDTYIEIPEFVEGADGKRYTVVELDDYMLYDNKTVEEVFIPKSVGNIVEALRISSSLVNIQVSNQNPYFYADNGVLIKRFHGKNLVYTYPARKKQEKYVVPKDVTLVVSNAFKRTSITNQFVLGEHVSEVGLHAFNNIYNPVTIYFKHESMDGLYLATEAFQYLRDGSKIIVKNNKMKEYFEKNINLDNIQVLSLEDSSNSSYRVPSTQLKFNDNTTSKKITLSPNETYSLRGQFTQLPEDTTDTVVWSSSDTSVASVSNGGTDSFTITAGKNAGKCTITGKDDSGRTLKVEVEVYIPMDNNSFDITCFSEKVDVLHMSTGAEDFLVAEISPLNCTALLGGVEWTSSDPNVVKILKSEDATTGRIEGVGVGTATVTAKVKENGKVFQKSVTVKVTKSLSHCNVLPIEDQAYTGKEIRPRVVVKDGNKTLVENVDYTLNYRNNVDKGPARIDITGINNYFKTITTKFMIVEKKVTATPTPKPTATPSQGTNSSATNLKNQTINVSSNYSVAYGAKPFNLNASAKTGLSYKSSNNGVVKVDKNGRVTIAGSGVATITITAAQTGTYKSATKKVEISVKPSQVTGLKMKSRNASSITLSWNRNTSAQGYKVYRYDQKAKKYVLIKTINKNTTTTFTDSKRASGTTYQYKVYAYKNVANANLIGASSSVVTGYTNPSTAAVQKVAQSKKQVKITWKKNNSVTGYEVYRSTSKNGKYAKVGTVKKNKTTSFTDKGVKKGNTYYYKVRTYKTITVNGKKVTVYSSWSTVKHIKVK